MKVLAKHPNYNGNVALFMMTEQEVKERNDLCDSGIEIISEGTFSKERFIPDGYTFNAIGKFRTNDNEYAVFADHSLTKIQ